MIGPRSGLPTLRQVLSRVHFRVTLFAVGIAGLTVLLAGFAAIGTYAQQNLKLISQTAGYSVAPAIVFDDAEAARASIAPLAQSGGVAEIAIVTRSGQVLAEWHKPADAGSGLVGRLAERLFFAKPMLAPVEHNGAVIGTVRVRGDAQVIAHYIRAGILGTLACLVITAIASWFLAGRLQLSVIAPLKAIADVAHAVRAEGAFDRRAPAASIREIDMLRNDFNALLAELEEWRHHVRRENEALSHLAAHDPLTELPNRAQFEQQVAIALAQAKRSGAPFAILYADGDGFKAVNDRYGHAAGDAVLIETAARLHACIRAGDMAARLGGDEFAMLLAAPGDADAVGRVSAAIAAAMAVPVELPSGESVVIGLSIGAAVYPRDGADVAALMNCADLDMYAAKEARRADREGVESR